MDCLNKGDLTDINLNQRLTYQIITHLQHCLTGSTNQQTPDVNVRAVCVWLLLGLGVKDLILFENERVS